MPQKWNIEQETIAFLCGIVACVLLALMSAGRDWTRSVMNYVADVMSFTEAPAVAVLRNVENLRNWTTERRALLVEIARLREENRAFKLFLGERAFEELHQLAKEGNKFPVVYRDPHLWWEDARIRTNKNLPVGSAIFDGANLVGMVAHQDGRSAWVRLITSPDFYAPVMLERSREVGVVSGDGNGGIWLRFLPTGDYKQGTKIFTAMGGTLPNGIPVGELSVETREYIPGSLEYRVIPGADVFRLQYVYASVGE